MPKRVKTPECKATQEAILQARPMLTIVDDCPACMNLDVLCSTTHHSSAAQGMCDMIILCDVVRIGNI